MISQGVSLAGALMILAAFGLQQAGRWQSDGAAYLVLNLGGSAILSYFAIEAANLGLTVLEGSWALISLWSLVKRLRSRRPSASG